MSVNFSAGEPDFDTPEHIKAAAVEALRKGMTKYTDVKGIEPLREAISEKYRARAWPQLSQGRRFGQLRRETFAVQYLASGGESGGRGADSRALLGQLTSDMALLAGGVPKLIPSNEASGFRITPDAARSGADTASTRVFILNSPCNPDRRDLCSR